MEEVNIYQILTDLGYELKDYGKEFRAKPLYRESDNDTVLRIYKDTGKWFDFSQNISGDINSLISMTLKLEGANKAEEWLKNKNCIIVNNKVNSKKPLLKSNKTFDNEMLLKLENNHEYWLDRNIDKNIIELFSGGVATAGKMKNRYVFPIFNASEKIVGFSGRDITSKSKIKWKHIGEKNEFLYPIFLNNKEINDKKEIFLVESIGDMLALYQNNIKNVVVLFGINLSLSVLNFMLKLAPRKIYISLNNDSKTNMVGNINAEKIKSKLLRYFDKNQIEIRLPPKKDFGEMDRQDIKNWYNDNISNSAK